MPQLMPLSWVFSSMILLVFMLVILLMYSVNYYSMLGYNKVSKKLNFFLWW